MSGEETTAVTSQQQAIETGSGNIHTHRERGYREAGQRNFHGRPSLLRQLLLLSVASRNHEVGSLEARQGWEETGGQ